LDQVSKGLLSADDVHLIASGASMPASRHQSSDQHRRHSMWIVTDGKRGEPEKGSAVDRDLVRPIEIGIPVQYVEVRNTVDFD